MHSEAELLTLPSHDLTSCATASSNWMSRCAPRLHRGLCMKRKIRKHSQSTSGSSNETVPVQHNTSIIHVHTQACSCHVLHHPQHVTTNRCSAVKTLSYPFSATTASVAQSKSNIITNLNREAKSTLGLAALRLNVGSTSITEVEIFLVLAASSITSTIEEMSTGHNNETA